LAVTDPWYLPYVNISRNIQSIVVDSNYAGTNYLISSKQAEAPTLNLDRREFAQIAYNTLLVNNCLTEDQDQDGLPYFYETEHGLNPNIDDSDSDQDGDGVSNLDEFKDGGDPSRPQSTLIFTEPGIYIQDIDCNTCPCLYRLEEETDILEEDNFFIILRNPETQAILRRSNVLTY